MNVIAIKGSARKNGKNGSLIADVFEELNAGGITSVMIQLTGKKVNRCIACYKCKENMDSRCTAVDDDFNFCLKKIIGANGIILGSPFYFSDVSASMKALIERAGYCGQGEQ